MESQRKRKTKKKKSLAEMLFYQNDQSKIKLEEDVKTIILRFYVLNIYLLHNELYTE